MSQPTEAVPDDVQAPRRPTGVRRTIEILEAEGRDPHVVVEVRARSGPDGLDWMVVSGIGEVARLFEGRDADMEAVPEGSVVYGEEPIVQVMGRYPAVAEPLAQAVGILRFHCAMSSRAARLRLAAGDLPVGWAGMEHPAVDEAARWAASVGGFEDAEGADHADRALGLLLGEPKGWAVFDRTVDPSAPRVVALGAVLDERASAVAAAEALGDRLSAVRLEVPHSRRGDLIEIAREVRWELDARGRSSVGVHVSGSLDEDEVRKLSRVVDGFFLDPAGSGPPVLEANIVEVDDAPVEGRGMLSSRKHLWRCRACGGRGIAPGRARLGRCPRCGGDLEDVLGPVLRAGVPEPSPSLEEARARAIREAGEAMGRSTPRG